MGEICFIASWLSLKIRVKSVELISPISAFHSYFSVFLPLFCSIGLKIHERSFLNSLKPSNRGRICSLPTTTCKPCLACSTLCEKGTLLSTNINKRWSHWVWTRQWTLLETL